MSYINKILNVLNKKDIFEKKAISATVYPKFLIRNFILEDKTNYTLDNNNTLININLKKAAQFFTFKTGSNPAIGSSIYAESQIFSSKYNPDLFRFESLVRPRTKIESLTTLPNLLNSFENNIKKNSKDIRTRGFTVLYPVRGGFQCYSNGLIGFLPNSHGLYAAKRYFNVLLKSSSMTVLGFINSLLNKQNIQRRYTSLDFFPLHSLKFKIMPQYFMHTSFTGGKKRKKKRKLGGFTLIFLARVVTSY